MKEIRKVLVIEDDLSILMGLEENLADEGYDVSTATNGIEGLSMAIEMEFQLVLLDIMIPGMNGFEVCKKIKKDKPLLPIIMLTARSSEMDKIAGLDYGADDYITKPFSLPELLARIRSLLRRSFPPKELFEEYSFGDIEIDFKRMKVLRDGQEIHFTKTELDIMKFFAENPGEAIHRHDLLNNIWGYEKVPTTRTVDNFIMEIRKKIEKNPSEPCYIKSISGVGYRFIPEG